MEKRYCLYCNGSGYEEHPVCCGNLRNGICCGEVESCYDYCSGCGGSGIEVSKEDMEGSHEQQSV